jgi:hypothetical protein
MKVLQKHEPATEWELKRASRVIRKMDVISVLRELIQAGRIQEQFRDDKYHKNGVLEYQISRVANVDVADMSKNAGEFRHDSNSNTNNAPKNDFSAHFGTDGFEDSPNPESASPESLRCPNCVHYRPATYPNGLCAEGLCQMDLPCHDFETGKF